MKSDDDCKTYQDQHLEPMLASAKEQGAKVLAQPQPDACARLKR